MNAAMIRYILGYVLELESVLIAISGGIGLIYGEKQSIAYFIVAAVELAVGLLLKWKKPKDNVFYLKEGCIMTGLGWALMSLIGCLPFVISGEIPGFVDALFETASGLSTTGSSILTDVESLAHCTLFWRSLTHWIGGMGILVFLLAIMPLAGGSNINVMRAESPGPSVDKIVPKMKQSASILYILYIALMVIEFILLLCGGMDWFEALTLSFGTAGTGGFGVRNDSIAGYSNYIQWIIGVFMMLFGVNFNFYYYLVLRKWGKAFETREVFYYIGIFAVATLLIFLDIRRIFPGGDAIRHSFFQVGAVMTTTGYATADFDLWSSATKWILVSLMFCGACAGSTGGGIKVARIVILFKAVMREFRSYLHPHGVSKIRFEGKTVDDSVIKSVLVYIATFTFIFFASVFLVSLEGRDFTTNFTAIAATLNNIGPGLSQVGPTCNYSSFTTLSKLVMTFDMLAGRLELFPILLLFYPSLWKEAVEQHKAVRSRKARQQQ